MFLNKIKKIKKVLFNRAVLAQDHKKMHQRLTQPFPFWLIF